MNRLYKKLPESPGVYLMKDKHGRVLYVGKAVNLRRRVASYFTRANDARIEKLLALVKKIDCKKTASALEALILEAKLIKKLRPPYNIKEKDDKSFLYVEITKEEFPRVLLVRGTSKPEGERIGPFTSSSSIRIALKILRKIFPWSVHPAEKIGRFNRPCFEYEIGLCPGICIREINRADYLKNIKKLRLFLSGKKKELVVSTEREMKEASRKTEFEKAEKLRRQLFALRHIRDTALISQENFQFPTSPPVPRLRRAGNFQKLERIEGYDVSNISGTSAVGSMVVFSSSEPDKDEYRKFKIRTIVGQDDIGMIREVLRRRFQNDWPMPNLVLVDGGKGQVNAAEFVLDEFGIKIPVIGIAKGPKRKKNEFVGKLPKFADKKTLIRVRDEAHRFAVSYHKTLRNRDFMPTP